MDDPARLVLAVHAAQNPPEPPVIDAPEQTPPITAETLTVVEHRAKLLSEYKAATKVSEYAIYTGKSGIHKPQFLEWKAGKLPPSSSTTHNFERFLREKKATDSPETKEVVRAFYTVEIEFLPR